MRRVSGAMDVGWVGGANPAYGLWERPWPLPQGRRRVEALPSEPPHHQVLRAGAAAQVQLAGVDEAGLAVGVDRGDVAAIHVQRRSEARRVGKECVSTV